MVKRRLAHAELRHANGVQSSYLTSEREIREGLQMVLATRPGFAVSASHKILWYISIRFVSTLVVLSNLIV